MAGLQQLWSTTAADNDDADPMVNAREGQAPSTLNDSLRAMMARIKRFQQDISGTVLTTGGTADTYTLTTNEAFSSLVDGLMVGFTVHAANTGASTLNVDSLGAKPLRSKSGVSLLANELQTGVIYIAAYDTGVGEWLVRGQLGAFNLSGGIVAGGPITAGDTITASAGDAVTAADYIALKPSDYGSDKHGFFVRKTTTADTWEAAVSDGDADDGVLDFKVGSLKQNGKEILAEVAGINTQTDNYTLALTDAGKVVEMNKATAITLTVPPNSTAAFPITTRIDIVQLGAGQTTIAAGAGVTIRSKGSTTKITAQYGAASLYKRGTDEWVLVGDLE